MISPDEQARLERIITEVTARIPKRIYADDALFLLSLLERLMARVKELSK